MQIHVNSKSILSILLLCFAIHSHAAKSKGWYITPAGDTLHVTFRIPVNLFAKSPNYERLQWKVICFNDQGQSDILKPDQAREFFFIFRSLPVKMISVPNILHASNAGANPEPTLFLQLIKDGQVRLFRFYEYNGYQGNDSGSPDPVLKEAPGTVEIYLVQRSDGKLYRLGKEEWCEPFPGCFH